MEETTRTGSRWLRALRESLILLAVTLVAGLIWNSVSEGGIQLRRNHFPKLDPSLFPPDEEASPDTPEAVTTPPDEPRTTMSGDGAGGSAPEGMAGAGTEQGEPPANGAESEPAGGAGDEPSATGTGTVSPPPPPPAPAVPEKIHGLQVVSSEDALMYSEMGDIAVFLDARSRDNYLEGHIPGAYHLYNYQVERQIDDVLPQLTGADVVIVYCGGGDCEDSVHLASTLINEYGIEYGRVYVYKDGLKGWKDLQLEVVKGPERE